MIRKGESFVAEPTTHLASQQPCAGLGLPLTLGRCRLEALQAEAITAIAPFPGGNSAVDACLKPLGLRFPGPGESRSAAGARIVWAGRDTAFLIGAPPPGGLCEHAAISDQSDGWAGLRLEGADSEAVLARLVPLDLRGAVFGPGQCARAPINHMQALILRTRPDAFDIRVYRSMTATLVHELTEAMRGVCARHARA